jgi:hypothetical protein
MPSKTFACPQCDKAYTRNEKLKEHLYTHLRVKPYGCQECETRFTRANELRQHLKEQHLSGESSRFFTCQACGYSTLRKATMLRHGRICKRVAGLQLVTQSDTGGQTDNRKQTQIALSRSRALTSASYNVGLTFYSAPDIRQQNRGPFSSTNDPLVDFHVSTSSCYSWIVVGMKTFGARIRSIRGRFDTVQETSTAIPDMYQTVIGEILDSWAPLDRFERGHVAEAFHLVAMTLSSALHYYWQNTTLTLPERHYAARSDRKILLQLTDTEAWELANELTSTLKVLKSWTGNWMEECSWRRQGFIVFLEAAAPISIRACYRYATTACTLLKALVQTREQPNGPDTLRDVLVISLRVAELLQCQLSWLCQWFLAEQAEKLEIFHPNRSTTRINDCLLVTIRRKTSTASWKGRATMPVCALSHSHWETCSRSTYRSPDVWGQHTI